MLTLRPSSGSGSSAATRLLGWELWTCRELGDGVKAPGAPIRPGPWATGVEGRMLAHDAMLAKAGQPASTSRAPASGAPDKPASPGC